MRRVALLAWAVLVAGLIAGPVAARVQIVVSGVQAPARDPTQAPPPRPIPIGTGTITGVVTASDTGRPVREARVTLSGQVTILGVDGQPVTSPVPGAASVTITLGGGRVGAAGVGPGAAVRVPTTVSRSATTDTTGRFTISKLPAGRYTLNVTTSRNQYLSMVYGQKRTGGPGAPIQLADGQQVTANMQMMRGGVITGTVYGDDGDPLSNVQVRGWRYQSMNGFRRLMSTGFATTDDRGGFRMFNLQPGDYLISATPNNDNNLLNDRSASEADQIDQAIAAGAVQKPATPGLPSYVLLAAPPPMQQMVVDMSPTAYLPTYFPGTGARAAASVIHVAGGDEHTGTNINVQYIRAGNLQGTVTGALNLNQGVTVQVSLMNDDPTAELPNTTRVDPNGKFTFRALAPGKYTLFAQTVPGSPPMTFVNGVMSSPPPGPPRRLEDSEHLWARATATVDGPSTANVTLSLSPGRSISGMVVFNMEKAPDLSRARLSVMLSNAPSPQSIPSGTPLQGQVEPDGHFTINGVIPGLYTLRASGAGMMKSATVGGEDTLDFPLNFTADRDITDAVLTLTDKISELAGTLTDAGGKPVADASVMVVSTDDRFWSPGSRRIVLTRSGADGRYTARGLPPGDYYLAVVTDLDFGGQYDPEFLKSLAGASTRIVITEGAKSVQDLRVGG